MNICPNTKISYQTRKFVLYIMPLTYTWNPCMFMLQKWCANPSEFCSMNMHIGYQGLCKFNPDDMVLQASHIPNT